jgi:hypothetical protein
LRNANIKCCINILQKAVISARIQNRETLYESGVFLPNDYPRVIHIAGSLMSGIQLSVDINRGGGEVTLTWQDALDAGYNRHRMSFVGIEPKDLFSDPLPFKLDYEG